MSVFYYSKCVFPIGEMDTAEEWFHLVYYSSERKKGNISPILFPHNANHMQYEYKEDTDSKFIILYLLSIKWKKVKSWFRLSLLSIDNFSKISFFLSTLDSDNVIRVSGWIQFDYYEVFITHSKCFSIPPISRDRNRIRRFWQKKVQ